MTIVFFKEWNVNNTAEKNAIESCTDPHIESGSSLECETLFHRG